MMSGRCCESARSGAGIGIAIDALIRRKVPTRRPPRLDCTPRRISVARERGVRVAFSF